MSSPTEKNPLYVLYTDRSSNKIYYEVPLSSEFSSLLLHSKVMLYYEENGEFIPIESKKTGMLKWVLKAEATLQNEKERPMAPLQEKGNKPAEISKKEAEIMKLENLIKECEQYTRTPTLQALKANNSPNKQVKSHNTSSSRKKVSFNLDKNVVYEINSPLIEDAAREILKSFKQYLEQKKLKDLSAHVKKEISDGTFSKENLQALSEYAKEVKNTYFFGKISEILEKVWPYLTENEKYEKIYKIYSLYCLKNLDHQHLKEFEKYAKERLELLRLDQSLFFSPILRMDRVQDRLPSWMGYTARLKG